MTYILLILIPLSAWRLSRMIRKESGPFAMFTHFRNLIGIDCGKCYEDGGIQELFSCNKCLGWWCSAIFVAIWLSVIHPFAQNVSLILALPLIFASSGATLFLETIDEKFSLSCKNKHEPDIETLPPEIVSEKKVRHDSGLPQAPPYKI